MGKRRKDWRTSPRQRDRDEPFSDFAERLADVRYERGLTQKEAAERIGCAVSTLRRWERDQAVPQSGAMWQAVARFLRMSMDEVDALFE